MNFVERLRKEYNSPIEKTNKLTFSEKQLLRKMLMLSCRRKRRVMILSEFWRDTELYVIKRHKRFPNLIRLDQNKQSIIEKIYLYVSQLGLYITVLQDSENVHWRRIRMPGDQKETRVNICYVAIVGWYAE